MSERNPLAESDIPDYERPNQRWDCGWAADGRACPMGPDGRGQCRATHECRPTLELKSGETKGRYRCARPKSRGGSCEHGPLPDGTCGCAIPRCQPVASLRALRGQWTAWVSIFSVAVLLVGVAGPGRMDFVSPGELSTPHSSAAFARRQIETQPHGADSLTGSGKKLTLEEIEAQLEGGNCAGCHKTAMAGPSEAVNAALHATPSAFNLASLFETSISVPTRMDAACAECHKEKDFHQPNVGRNASCSSCHVEHKGDGPMMPVHSSRCVACHGDVDYLTQAAQRGNDLHEDLFVHRKGGGLVRFSSLRPADGFTAPIHLFSKDHPEFRLKKEQSIDPNTLKFNHERHLSQAMPKLNGKRLECSDCHELDAPRAFHLKMSYAQHCQECHPLQFDASYQELTIPHGDPETVLTYLDGLAARYRELAIKENLATETERRQFTREALTDLFARTTSPENLKHAVFFSDGKRQAGEPLELEIGCAYCHEVKQPESDEVPRVTPPVIPDRWMSRSQFDHSRHRSMRCDDCHRNVLQSRDTADILMPGIADCIDCHSPQGKVRHDCVTCHQYHNTPAWDRPKPLHADLK